MAIKNVTAEEAVSEVEVDEAGRPMRSDAKRNYERLVAAARKVFSHQGGGASMEAIAKEACVGIGTLYRHFPKRIDIVEAVYREDVAKLVQTAENCVATLEPWPAVEAFLDAFMDYAQGKRTFLNELTEAYERDPQLKSEMVQKIHGATDLVITRAQQAGVVRSDINGRDVVQLIAPLCTNVTISIDQARRLLTMVEDGLRATR